MLHYDNYLSLERKDMYVTNICRDHMFLRNIYKFHDHWLLEKNTEPIY